MKINPVFAAEKKTWISSIRTTYFVFQFISNSFLHLDAKIIYLHQQFFVLSERHLANKLWECSINNFYWSVYLEYVPF